MSVNVELQPLLDGGDRSAVFGDPPDKKLFQRLRKLLHPDTGGDSAMFDALNKVWNGEPNPIKPDKGIEWFRTDRKMSLRMKPIHAQDLPVGRRLMFRNSIGLIFRPEHRAATGLWYFSAAPWRFSGPDMRKQCLDGPDAFLPRLRANGTYGGQDGDLLVTLDKSEKAIPLDRLLAWSGGTLDPKHVAWILSGLYNIACYLNYIGVVHLGIEPSAITVEPETHRVALPGGWIHATNEGHPPPPVPASVAAFLPRKFRGAKKVTHAMTHECIRAIGRMLLGDTGGLKLALGPQTPLTKFLLSPAEGNAIEQYGAWKQATRDAFGGHHFHKMDEALVANPNIVYKEK
jgi:hypothetical protein